MQGQAAINKKKYIALILKLERVAHSLTDINYDTIPDV